MGDFLTRAYRKGIVEAEGFPIAEVSDYLEQPDTLVWVDVCTPSKEEPYELAPSWDCMNLPSRTP